MIPDQKLKILLRRIANDGNNPNRMLAREVLSLISKSERKSRGEASAELPRLSELETLVVSIKQTLF